MYNIDRRQKKMNKLKNNHEEKINGISHLYEIFKNSSTPIYLTISDTSTKHMGSITYAADLAWRYK